MLIEIDELNFFPPYTTSFPRQCIQMSLQTDLHGSVSWVRGQESEVLCTCVLRIGRGVIPVCAWPGGVSGPEGGGVRASLAHRNA